MFDLIDEPDKEESTEKDPDYTGLIILAALLPLIFFFRYLGKFDLGLNLSLCLAVNIVAIKFRWKLRKHIWFWIVMAFVLGAEIPIVLTIKWPHEWVPGVALLPIGFAGFLIAMGAIHLAELVFAKTLTEEEED